MRDADYFYKYIILVIHTLTVQGRCTSHTGISTALSRLHTHSINDKGNGIFNRLYIYNN